MGLGAGGGHARTGMGTVLKTSKRHHTPATEVSTTTGILQERKKRNERHKAPTQQRQKRENVRKKSITKGGGGNRRWWIGDRVFVTPVVSGVGECWRSAPQSLQQPTKRPFIDGTHQPWVKPLRACQTQLPCYATLGRPTPWGFSWT